MLGVGGESYESWQCIHTSFNHGEEVLSRLSIITLQLGLYSIMTLIRNVQSVRGNYVGNFCNFQPNSIT